MKVFSDSWPSSLTIIMEDSDFYRERSKKTGKMGGALMATKNRAHGQSKYGGKYITDRQKDFRSKIASACSGIAPQSGPCRLTVEMTCRQTRKVDGIAYPQPDSDSCLAAVRDALQARRGFRGVILDDAQIVGNSISARTSTDTPRQCGLRIELDWVQGWTG